MAVAASIVGREYETHVTGRESAVPEAETGLSAESG
jgi:hypothetical protein